MQDGEEILRQVILRIKFEGDSAKTEIKNPGATRSSFAEDSISVRAYHRDAFRFALDSVTGAKLNFRGCSGHCRPYV